ncbi:MAG: thioredoxin family protein [Pseudonocardiaceae bacterium]
MSGWALGLGTLVVATVFGLLWRHRQGRVQAPAGTALSGLVLCRIDSVAAVTLLQLSTPMCARCPQARALLSELAAGTPGIGYTEIDLAEHPELATELRVRSTPTVLAVSRTGHELFRVTGVPRRAELLTALQSHL